jgi:hypothetical protein
MAIKSNTNSSTLQIVLDVVQVYGKDKYGNPKTRERTLVITASRERQYRLIGKGLKPNTQHFVYFNGERVVNTDIRPTNYRYTTTGTTVEYGAPLVTNAKGVLDGYFLYRVNTPTNSKDITDYYYLLNSVTGRKYIIVTDYAGEDGFQFDLTTKASTPEYYGTLVEFLNKAAASYCVDYIDIKAKFNLKSWLTKNKFTVEG